jgi:hypothetical protein
MMKILSQDEDITPRKEKCASGKSLNVVLWKMAQFIV